MLHIASKEEARVCVLCLLRATPVWFVCLETFGVLQVI